MTRLPALRKTKTKPEPTLAERWSALRSEARKSAALDWATRAFVALGAGDGPALLALCAAHPPLLSTGAPGDSILDRALVLGREEIALGLLARGAWAGSGAARQGGAARDSAQAPMQGSLDTLWARLASHAKEVRFLLDATRALAESGRPAPAPGEWMELALDHGKFDLAASVMESMGGSLSPGRLASLDEEVASLKAGHPLLRAMAMGEGSDQGRGAWKLVLAIGQAWSQRSVEAFWKALIGHDAIHGLDLLVEGGLAPIDWASGSGKTRPRQSLLGFAATSRSHECFSCLRNIPEAAEALRREPLSPHALAACSPTDIVAMHRLGVDIGAQEERGRNFLHFWGAKDFDVRDGWRSVGRLRPDMLVARDASGLTPVDAQRAKLHGRKRDAFEAVIAGIERVALRAEIDKPAEQGAAPARRARL